jgi:hypothetical protein
MVVPQTSQTALVAGLPFFSVTSWWFLPSLFARHLTQYIAIWWFTSSLDFLVVNFGQGTLDEKDLSLA